MSFVHLKTFSEYSIKRGINKVKSLVKSAKNNNMGAIALTDYNGLFGTVAFYKAARKEGLKPIIGINALIEQDDGNVYQLTLLAKNETGYKKILELNSKSFTENRKRDSGYIKEEWLGDVNNIIVLSGGQDGLIGQKILSGHLDEAKEIAQQMKDVFGEDFYIELQRDGTENEDNYMTGAVEIASSLEISPVATHPVYFEKREDFVAHETRFCISNQEKLFDMKRKKLFNKEMYLKSPEEMQELFSDIPVALENTINIAKKCNIDIQLDVPVLPKFPTPNNQDADSYFAEVSRKGLDERLKEIFPNVLDRQKHEKEYKDRLEVEIGIIQRMGFPGYFLIVGDFITWAKEQDIPVGPGRGSGAGSLVAYSMKITDLDPLPYGLLFERFLNPERVSMPDFDIDFCQLRREEVYEYVRQKYGTDAVCKVGTFGTMASKAVVRDVGRALEYQYDFVDTLAKLITIKPGKDTTLNQFIFGDEQAGIPADEKFLARYNNEYDVKKLVDIALKIEGLTKQVGVGAAGVVISADTLVNYTPLYTPDIDAPPQTQFDKSDVEKAGLVKFDFLGLSNLTIVKEAVDLIHKEEKENGIENKFDLRKIPLDDQDVYKNIYGNLNTGSVFQFESSGMARVLQKANPTELADIIAINALYRPGPMDIIPEWLVARKLPEEQRTYPHPLLREVLKETAGFMIYQEQVMQCAQIIAGYSLGGADILRRAMGKKDAEEMRQQREVFIQGAKQNNISEEKANEIFDLINKFSGYGFNKSHAAAYSFLSYQNAYLKHHYTKEFFTATLNACLGTLDTDKIALAIQDATKNDLKILGPNINNSRATFSIEGDGEIRYALSGLKGVGEKAAHAIEVERDKNGPFVDFYDFLERVGKGHVNKRVIESLVRSGALDELHPNRAEIFENIKDGLDYVSKYRKKQLDNTSVLGDAFDEDDEPKVKKTRKKKETILVRPEFKVGFQWEELETLKNEKTSLGYFFSANPYNTHYVVALDGFKVATPMAEIKSLYNSDFINEVFVGALVEKINWWKSKKGAFVTISDGTTSQDVRMFESFLNENKDWLKPDAFIALRLKVEGSQSDDVGDDLDLTLSVKQGFSLEQTKALIADKVFVGTNNDSKLTIDEQVEVFKEICNNHKAENNKGHDIILCGDDSEGRKKVKLTSFKVKYNEKLIQELEEVFSKTWVKTLFKKDVDDIDFPELNSKNKKQYVKKRNSFST